MIAEFEPCELCGCPIRLDRDAGPGPRRHGLPEGGPVWREDWEQVDPTTWIASWHSPKRCQERRNR